MNFEKARANLIKNLSAVIADKTVLKAMSQVPREDFIPPEMMKFL